MAREGDSFFGNTFLEAAVAEKSEDVMIENCVFCCVVESGGAFARESKTDGIGDALAERAGGGFDAWSFMELRVAWGDRMQLTEVFHFLQGEFVAGEMQPRIEEHRAVACGEQETVAVQPAWGAWAIGHGFAKKHGTDFCAAEWQTEVT
jgi:hypothetical protein